MTGSDMRILLVNDDGIDARGISVLEQIALSLSSDVYVVAPASQHSGAGHSFTLSRPLAVRRRDDRHFAVDGTPTDCVLFACRELLADKKPDLILSGINIGANFGSDITYSGTVGAAIEGTLQGIRSIALSLYVKDFGKPALWRSPLAHGAEIIQKLCAMTWAENMLMNVNFPDVEPQKVTGVKAVPLGYCKIGNTLDMRKNYAGQPYFWIVPTRETNPEECATDIREVCDNQAVTVTPVSLDLTHAAMLEALRGVF